MNKIMFSERDRESQMHIEETQDSIRGTKPPKCINKLINCRVRKSLTRELYICRARLENR